MAKEEIIDKEIVKEDAPDKITYHFVNTLKNLEVKSKICYKREDKVTVFPFYIDRENKPQNKYRKIESFSFEGFRGKFPSGFLTKAERGGYGTTRYLTPLRKFVEKEFEYVTNITITKKGKTGATNGTLFLNFADFEIIRKGLSSLIRSSNESSRNFLHNYFSRSFPSTFPIRRAIYQSGVVSRILTEYTNIENRLSADDKKAIFDLFNRLSLSRQDIIEKQDLIKTREVIEKKFIEDVTNKFEHYLGLKRISEERWQEFFKDNSWIFSQLFAYPAVIFKDKAYVGGKTIQNTEGRIVDFLYANKLTKNSAIIEIKRRTSNMFGKNPYRGSSVFALSKELSGAISQVLDQRDTFMKEFRSIGTNQEIIAFNPKCLVVIGRISDLNEERCKSFELVRTALKDVEIITYDELYERIKAILSIFSQE
jgi:hypothetical protein